MTRLFSPPAPPVPDAALPFLHYLRAVRTNALGIWPRAAYEEDFLSHDFMGRRLVMLHRPDAIQHVLVHNHENYRRSAASLRILRPITGDGLLLSTGETWRWQRRTIAPALAPRSLPLLLRHVVSATEEAVTDLATRPGPINLLAEMQTLALEIAGRSMFSLETRAFGAELRDRLAHYAEKLARPHMLDLLLPAGIPAPLDVPRYLFRRRWMGFIDRIIATRLDVPAAPAARDLFDLLCAARDPETGRAFTRAELRDQVATMILAGHETTAVALFWSFFLLANDAETQARVAAEAANVEITAATAATAIEQLPITRAVLNEALRLYPPAFTLVRQAIGPDRCDDIEIPAGGVVMIAPWVLHRHRKLWRDPGLFDPTRFLPGASPIPRFAYLPFGAGPRVCVGAQFALAEATLVLASLIRSFTVALRSGEHVMPVAVITTQPDHPPMFILSPRAEGPTAWSAAVARRAA